MIYAQHLEVRDNESDTERGTLGLRVHNALNSYPDAGLSVHRYPAFRGRYDGVFQGANAPAYAYCGDGRPA